MHYNPGVLLPLLTPTTITGSGYSIYVNDIQYQGLVILEQQTKISRGVTLSIRRESDQHIFYTLRFPDLETVQLLRDALNDIESAWE
jgi:hypothetical protein